MYVKKFDYFSFFSFKLHLIIELFLGKKKNEKGKVERKYVKSRENQRGTNTYTIIIIRIRVRIFTSVRF